MKTYKQLLTGCIAILLLQQFTIAQNTFPSNGRTGIYTTAPAASLQVRGSARFGSLTNYINIDSATGNLSFSGVAGYRVAGNKYAFQSQSNRNVGLFFNTTTTQYEFRDYSAVPVFYINANNGNGVFKGSLKIGAYTLPITDGTNGQLIATNGAGTLSWANYSTGVSQWSSNGIKIYYSSGNTGIGTSMPGAKLHVQGDALINGITVGRGGGSNAVNTAIGNQALYSNTTGSYNTAIGNQALYFNTTGSYNTADGTALALNVTGSYNTASGLGALYSNTGSYNTANGGYALNNSIDNSDNTASGFYSMINHTTGSANTAIGSGALSRSPNALSNSLVGHDAASFAGNNNANIIMGDQAGHGVASDDNVMFGKDAGLAVTSGGENTFLGYAAGSNIISERRNTCIGKNTRTGADNGTAIGYTAYANTFNKVVFGNSSVTVIGGQVGWSTFSDGRFKKDIQQNVPGLTFINKLNPVTYRIELTKFEKFLGTPDSVLIAVKDELAANEQKLHSGFIAQEVEQAAKAINYDFDGVHHPQNEKDNYSIVYESFIPSLVKAIQELSKRDDELKKEYDDQQKQLDDITRVVKQLQQTGTAITFAQNEISVMLTNAALEQNIPNPFSNTTVINYTLPQKFSNAAIVITDNNGKTLKQINVSGAGKGSVKVDAATLAAGAYHYSLLIDGKLIGTKQMIHSK